MVFAGTHGGTSSEAVFELGKTRGKGNAEHLLGDSKAVVVSDDYAVYRNLKNPHQLCCAHVLRKLRDLAASSEITGAIHDHCVAAYKTFAELYTAIEMARVSADLVSSYDELLPRLQQFVHAHPDDPVKLARVKKQVALRIANYLTCLLYPDVASDNNAAERSLRHLVLKRKISFGSLSEKTADTLAVLLSVLLSYKRRGTLRDYLMGV
jgi:transposase